MIMQRIKSVPAVLSNGSFLTCRSRVLPGLILSQALYLLVLNVPAWAQTDCVNLGNACLSDAPADCLNDNPGPQGPVIPGGFDPDTCCFALTCDPGTQCCPCNVDDDGVFSEPLNGDLVPLTGLELSKPNYIDQAIGSHPIGLYINSLTSPTLQTNEIDDLTNATLVAHFNEGMARSAGIVPRSRQGTVDHANGLIGVISIGFSNPSQEFATFQTNKIICPGNPPDPNCPGQQSDLDGMNEKLVIINGADPMKALCDWDDVDFIEDGNPWKRILDPNPANDLLLIKGFQPGPLANDLGIDVGKNQVQVAWVELVLASPGTYCLEISNCCDGCCQEPGCTGSCDACDDFPGDPDHGCRFPNWMEAGELPIYKVVLQNLLAQFPNIRLVFLSSRTYGGWGNEGDSTLPGDDNIPPFPCGAGSPEPFAYQNGFSVQRLVFDQIFAGIMDFMAPCTLNPDGLCYPYIVWGPYLWSNGIKIWSGIEPGNPVKLSYETTLPKLQCSCKHACADGTHPSRDIDSPGFTSGQSEVANRLYEFFRNHPLSENWFLDHPLIEFSNPKRFFVDRLQDRDSDPSAPLILEGIAEITIRFDEAVRKPGNAGPIDENDIDITCSGGVPPCPTIFDVENIPLGSNEYKITLSGPIPPGQWTTLEPDVEDFDGNPIRPDVWGRVTLGYLPGDINRDLTVTTADLALLSSWITNGDAPAGAENWDVNRSEVTNPQGVPTIADRVRLEQLLIGQNTLPQTPPGWLNKSLPPL